MGSPAKTSYVCLPCRASYKQPYRGDHERRCPRCAAPLIHVGSAFAAPKRRDTAAWRTLAVLLEAGVRFHKSCCGGPGHRPRTRFELREYVSGAATPSAPRLVVTGVRQVPGADLAVTGRPTAGRLSVGDRLWVRCAEPRFATVTAVEPVRDSAELLVRVSGASEGQVRVGMVLEG
ncbi:hypothetical protein GCM10023235_64120 [Kitasatospora terrestris]|uniref:RNHCP domain-containing protein n=1 Tax=Kitasatospora terrestris TaxID=258051 RepID=A0ABP9EF41_9ACTN